MSGRRGEGGWGEGMVPGGACAQIQGQGERVEQQRLVFGGLDEKAQIRPVHLSNYIGRKRIYIMSELTMRGVHFGIEKKNQRTCTYNVHRCIVRGTYT